MSLEIVSVTDLSSRTLLIQMTTQQFKSFPRVGGIPVFPRAEGIPVFYHCDEIMGIYPDWIIYYPTPNRSTVFEIVLRQVENASVSMLMAYRDLRFESVPPDMSIPLKFSWRNAYTPEGYYRPEDDRMITRDREREYRDRKFREEYERKIAAERSYKIQMMATDPRRVFFVQGTRTSLAPKPVEPPKPEGRAVRKINFEDLP